MKSFAKACLISSIGYQAVEASFLSCKVSDYRVYLKGFSQGFQKDPMSVDSACFGQVSIYEGKIAQFFDSFYTFTFDDWLAPVYLFQENLVEMSDTFVACQTTNFAKQLYIRTTSWGGLIEMGVTIGAAFLKDVLDEGASPLYNAADTFLNTDSCARTSRSVGEILHYVINVQTAESVFRTQLNWKLENWQ